MSELWRNIPGYDGRYQVSSDGCVRNSKGRIFSPMIAKRVPYRSVVLIGPDGKSSRKLVHVLVLETFIGRRPDGLVARHLNGIASNNRLTNLAWGTVAENVADRTRHGTENIGEQNPRAKLSKEQVAEIRSMHIPQILIAKRFGISESHVSNIRSLRVWK